ncbi:unnamed protein product [Meganyctiphanes norvegica]|uniref:Uncharacterized protein n=1 Tax=Meganyctiphanes norvegica TaxID=48144 RepID=A0AAV2QSZ0_MEGNR
MFGLLYLCTFVCLVFGKVYGDPPECARKYKEFTGCSVCKIEFNGTCQTYLNTSDVDGSFVYYIKPLYLGETSIHLDKTHTKVNYTEHKMLFDAGTMRNINKWHKIKIVRNQAPQSNNTFFYSLEIDDYRINNRTEPITLKNQDQVVIRVKTVTALWSFDCDPRDYQTSDEGLGPREGRRPVPAPGPTSTVGKGNQNTSTFSLRGYHVAITAALILGVTLVVLFIRHKRRNTDYRDM